MNSICFYGTWTDVLSVHVKVDGEWKIVRDIKPNIDGIWKNTGYIPKDRSHTGNWSWQTTYVSFNYGSYYLYMYPQVTSNMLYDIIYIEHVFSLVDGTSNSALNRQWALYTSELESGGQNTFVDTGLRVTPTALNTTYVFSGYFSQRNIKRVIIMPISWFSGSYSYYQYPNKVYKKL